MQTSTDDSTWQDFNGVKVVDNLIEVHPGYARTTFDAVGPPEGGTAYVRVVFPELDGVRYETAAGARKVVSNTDVQLAKVTFLQERIRIRSRILIRRRIPIRMTARAMAQSRFALRLRGPQTLCRIRTNAFTRSERPVAGKVVPPNRRNRAAP